MGIYTEASVLYNHDNDCMYTYLFGCKPDTGRWNSGADPEGNRVCDRVKSVDVCGLFQDGRVCRSKETCDTRIEETGLMWGGSNHVSGKENI